MAIGKQLRDFFLGPAANVLSEFVTDKDKLKALQGELLGKALEHEESFLGAARDVLVAEAQSQSWLTRSWRPISMLIFVALISASWLGLTPDSVTPEIEMRLLDIVQLGLGGYMIGRSGEQIARQIAPVLGAK